jgi:TonB-dependent receptor
MKFKSILSLAFCLLAISAIAQEKSKIRGTVIDSSAGEPLMFANVLIKGSNPTIGTQTDLDGNYELSLNPGTYDIEFSYVGYIPQTVKNVEINAGEVTVLDILMYGESAQLSEVIVEANRIDRTENALLALQRKAVTIQDGISAQEISRYGSNNAAESMKRVTGASVVGGRYVVVRGLGDRYSSAQLNGQPLPSTDPYRNSTQLDLIPSNLLDNIIASKTFTPDQPGNFTGGNVDIKTKSFPERFTLSASVGFTYNTQSSMIDNFLTQDGGNTDWLGYDDGTRAIPELLNDPEVRQAMNSRLFFSNARNDRDRDAEARILDESVHALNPSMVPVRESNFMNHSASVSVGNQFKLGNNPLGVLLGLNYSRSYNYYENGAARFFEFRSAENQPPTLRNFYDLNDTRGVDNPTVGGLLNLSYKFLGSQKISFNALYNHDAEIIGRSLFGSFPGKLSAGQAQDRTLHFIERDLRSYQLNGEHVFGKSEIELNWGASYVRTAQEEPDLRIFPNIVQQPNSENPVYTIDPAEFPLPAHFWRDLVDDQYLAKVDLSIPFAQNRSKANKFKVGFLHQTKDRTFEEALFNYNNSPYTNPLTSDFNAFFGSGNIGLIGYLTRRLEVVDECPDGPGGCNNALGVYSTYSGISSMENSYTGDETITAGYGMFTYELNRLKIIGGARLEKTDISVASLDTTETRGEIDQVNVLPSVNLIFGLNKDMNLRGSFTQTLARPNMREMAPFSSFDFGSGIRITGNFDLELTTVTNFDLRWEWFPKPGELIAISFYYKDFTNPIVTKFLPIANNPEQTFDNADEGIVYGAEFEFRKNLEFISPLFSDFKFSTNLSLINSKVDIPGDPKDPSTELGQVVLFNPEKGDSRPFPGQSNVLYNASLNYVNPDAGFDAFLSFNYFSERLASIGQGPIPDFFEQPRPQLDFAVQKAFDPISVKLTLGNLLNPDTQILQTLSGEDFILTDYRNGRTIGLTLSYNL